jgi:hypothetical protein
VDFDLFTRRSLFPSFGFCCLQVDFELSFEVLDELNYYCSCETYWPVVLIASYRAIAEGKVKTAIGSGVTISFQSTTRSNRVSDAHRRRQSYCLHPGAWDTSVRFRFWRKTNFPFQRFLSRSHIRISDNRGPPWSGPARIFFLLALFSLKGI